MIKYTKRPNGTIKRVQYVKAHHKGISSMGTPYLKGDPIIHMSSSRCTGETFVLLPSDISRLYEDTPGKWSSTKKWSERLAKKWFEEHPEYKSQFN